VRLVVLLHVGGCRHRGPAGHRVPPTTRVLVPGRRAVAAGVLPSRRHVRIHSVTVTLCRAVSMPVDFRRHLVGKTPRNVSRRDGAYIRFVGKSVIIWTFS